METIYIIKQGEISHDDQYYYFNRNDTHGDIYGVYCSEDKALAFAKGRAESLYEEYSTQLDDIEWDQYSYNDEDEKRISTIEGKLNLLKELCYKLITIEVYSKPNLDDKLSYIKSIQLKEETQIES